MDKACNTYITDKDCIFCKIIDGQIPSSKVYEDDEVVAFKDINPQAKVHVLIVPRNHYKNVAELAQNDSAVLAPVSYTHLTLPTTPYV